MEATTTGQTDLRSATSTGKASAAKDVVKKVVMEGVPCVVIGGLSGMIGGRQMAQDVVEDAGYQVEETTEESSASENVTESGIQVATSVNDEMTFAEAFAAARQEVGAGGAFEWRGTVYGTYYANEWDAMSSEEQAQFSAAAMGSAPQTAPQTAETSSSVEDNNLHNVSNNTTAESTTSEPVAESDADVQVVDVMQVNEDGTLVTYTQAYVNGDEVIFAEVTGDDIVDVMITDANQNGELDKEDFFDVSDQGIRQSQLNAVHEFNQEDNEQLAQLDDFENNAGGELLACRDAATNVEEIKVISYAEVSTKEVEVRAEEMVQSTLSDENFEMGSIDDFSVDGDCGDDLMY